MIDTTPGARFELGPAASSRLREAHGPVIATFQLTEIPAGDAPLEIKEAWLTDQLTLPVRTRSLDQSTILPGYPYYADRRTYHAVEDYGAPVAITALEAVIALRNAEQHAAADYWRNQFRKHGMLVFHRSEGALTPLQIVNELADL